MKARKDYKSQGSRKKKERLREMLLQKRAEIWGRIAEQIGEKVSEDIVSTLGPALDEGDLSTLELGRDVDYGLLTMHAKMLSNIEQALERVEDGTYGTCEECGSEIGEKRLRAMPFALYCVECQRGKERITETDRGRIWMERQAQIEQNQGEEEEQ